MNTPIIVVNFKAFRESAGSQGLKLAKMCEDIAHKTGKNIAIAPQTVDISLIAREVDIPVLAQHVDNIPAGSFTGWTPVESVKAVGAVGTLINHSERRLELSDIDALIRRCESFSMETVVCADNLSISKACASLAPNFVAFEPPELIGGDISVTTAEPGIIRKAVLEIEEMNPKVKVLCGAGVKNGADVKRAIQLGTEGVLLSSGIVKAKDPEATLRDLVSGF